MFFLNRLVIAISYAVAFDKMLVIIIKWLFGIHGIIFCRLSLLTILLLRF